MDDLDLALRQRCEDVAERPRLHALAELAGAAADVEQRRELFCRQGGEPLADPARLGREHAAAGQRSGGGPQWTLTGSKSCCRTTAKATSRLAITAICVPLAACT